MTDDKTELEEAQELLDKAQDIIERDDLPTVEEFVDAAKRVGYDPFGVGTDVELQDSLRMGTVTIQLAKGGTLEVEYSALLLEQIRARYMIGDNDDIPPELIKTFIEQEMRSALEKVPIDET